MGNRSGVEMRRESGERADAARGEKGAPFGACLLSAVAAVDVKVRLHFESLHT